ncbi:MAG: hypothetical protein JNL43_07420 [Flavobacteriales bacterium]|nr:hypothetical protein [Flavobacteriales bacterium]HRH69914.1 hypothetical protein [Flavobacteriales bacterium]
MMVDLPLWISGLFAVTVLATLLLFQMAGRTRVGFLILVPWTALQSWLGLSGFYQHTTEMPPRILLCGVLPTLLFIIVLFNTKGGRKAIDALDLRTLTWLHSVRIPVEFVLWILVDRQLLSPSMSMGGTNFDIFSGITAPVAATLAFRNYKVYKRLLMIWNIVCLLLLFNVVITAAFAIPSPMQQHSFDQPNIAVLYFPFNLLPAVVVPIVLLAHLAAMRQLTK